MPKLAARLCCLLLPILFASASPGAEERAQIWVTAWTGSVQGPYPVGYPVAEPDLRFAFPAPDEGARDQTFRLMIKPDLWARLVRLRFSNVFGTRPLRLDGVDVALQASGGTLVHGTMQPVTFSQGQFDVAIPPGRSVWSDPVALPFVTDPLAVRLAGRRLAVSFHVAGASGPMTWHAKALTTSYLTPPGSGAHGTDQDDAAFPLSTTSWFFLDALDVSAPPGARTIVAFGDSITDGTASTLNGDDRWPDVLSHRLHAAYGARVAVVNAGIGGNELLGPTLYTTEQPAKGGPSALARLDRDVLGLSGVGAVIWLEGINDYNAHATTAAMIEGMRGLVQRVHAHGVRIIGGTLTSALHSDNAEHGTAEVDAKRRAQNEFIRNGGLFDGVADFDRATLDPRTGELNADYVPNSTIGGPGDKLHPNRAGYMAMGDAVDLDMLMGEAPIAPER